MGKRILSVGSCRPDDAAISAAMTRCFSAEVVSADDGNATIQALQSQTFDLVVVNRKLDIDYSDGIDVIRQIKAIPEASTIPIMLISNYADYQQQAVAAGAVPGFGKQELGSATFVAKLTPYLTEDA